MPIPQARRVTFAKNPLAEVVMQLTFPRLLEIDADLSLSFQKGIQSEYPLLSAGKVIEVAFDPEKGADSRASESRRYEFFSADRKWQAVLTSEFVALTTSDYTRWEDFKARIRRLLQ